MKSRRFQEINLPQLLCNITVGCYKFSFLVSLFAGSAGASSNRIQSILLNQAETQRIYLSPGLGSMIVFPCFLSEAFVGNEAEVQVQFSPNSKKTILLSLKKSFSHSTNLITTCENQRSHFVFDLIPSEKNHQDLIEIRGGYGRPTFVDSTPQTSQQNNQVHQKNSQKNPSKETIKRKAFLAEKPVLIREGRLQNLPIKESRR